MLDDNKQDGGLMIIKDKKIQFVRKRLEEPTVLEKYLDRQFVQELEKISPSRINRQNVKRFDDDEEDEIEAKQ